ncbi:MAG: hypothetical protein IJ038_02820 [Clostridia bacterium]|nr:hypothetical protein [Clostridia bacterium]
MIETSDFRDKYAKCPFYVGQDTRKIHCNGFLKENHIHISFDTSAGKTEHADKFCNRIFGCCKCPLYIMLSSNIEE